MDNVEILTLSTQNPSPSWLSEPGLSWPDPSTPSQSQDMPQCFGGEPLQLPSPARQGQQQHRRRQQTPSPITRLPVDILLYIASLRFLTLNDIVQWRATASMFYHSIPLPHATMILQAAFLFQIRPRRGHCESESPPTTATTPVQQQRPQDSPPHATATISPTPLSLSKDIHSLYKDRQLKDILARLTRLLTHPEFQPRLLRSSYSFRNRLMYSHHQHLSHQTRRPSLQVSRKKRTRRDLRDYPIFITGNPPDIVRLAIEFGHIPFVDHLLYRGFRPRDLPEYFSLIPFLSAQESLYHQQRDAGASLQEESRVGEQQESEKRSRADTVRSREHMEQSKARQTSLLKRSLELNQIWEYMRVVNQELMDACSRADVETTLKILDTTLIHPRPTLDSERASPPRSNDNIKGKQRHSSYDAPQSRHDSIGTGSVSQILVDDNMGVIGAGMGTSSSHQGSSTSHSRDQTANSEDATPHAISTIPLLSQMPNVIHRSTIFQPRQRVESGGSQEKQQGVHEHSSSGTHMPWVDGRALACALLAVCFRRDGHESEEAEALEESKTVPIVSEILKYDCLLTAQSLGQAVLAIAYSRPAGSLKRNYEQRLKRQQRQEKGSLSGRPEPVSRTSTSSSTGESETSVGGVDVGVMDLLMERIGPREWLKLIKYYLQRQEFDDLSVILELCPFKGPQLEIKQKDTDNGYRHDSRVGARDAMTSHNYHRQQARELICREAGICGVGSRLGHFNGHGIGQASYNVSATLHRISRVIFTGSGARFNHSYMLPRGGFRGIGGNASGQPSSADNSGGGNSADSGESYSATEEDSHQSTPAFELGHPFDQPQSSNIPQQQGQWRSQLESNSLKDNGNHTEDEVVTDDDDAFDLNPDQFDTQDSSLTFGGIGSSTTSNSHPGPGIVGIAIQVQAPEHILKSLLKLGFRFFSICDLSISDTRHPLTLQFKQQEKMNRQLIEFCMIPNADIYLGREFGEGCSRQDAKGKAKKTSRRDGMALYDAVDQEYHAQAAERFLYPAANNPARPSASIPALPSQVQGSSGSRGGTTEAQELSAMTTVETAVSEATSLAVQEPSSAPVSSTLSPSNRLQFVLPPMHLGESFESITSASSLQKNPPPSAQLPLSQTQYHSSGLAKSMPLPIQKSMAESKRGVKSYMSVSSPSIDYGESPTISTHQHMVNATTKRRVREYLSSEYIDLMTMGICLYQACYHKKERLLTILLEHRILIAQDALSGAVQVAASVGWRHGLEMLLMEHGDMEAEVDAVVTTTSEQVHHGTSMKWDHASVAPLYPGKIREPSHHSGVGSSGATGEVFAINRGLRRHQSDGSRLNRSNSNYTDASGNNDIGGGIGVGIGGGFGRETGRTFEIARRASFDFSYLAPLSTSVAQPYLSSAPILPHMGPLIPTTRSSSLRNRLLPFLPNLSSHDPSNTFKRQKAKRQPEQNQNQCLDADGKPRLQQRPHKPVTALLLSTSGLWSHPTVMLQRKNRNAVIALMAATTRNDPDLVHWLVESFADIKIIHLMQALMIACDRGLIRVVQVLVGRTATVQSSNESESGIRTDRNSPRLLFRQWLTFQHKKIMELTLLASGAKDSLESSKSGFNQRRFDSFPFIFLMESSPIFRHYYQILNTLSSCQFMTRKGASHRKSASASPLLQFNTHHSMVSMADSDNTSIPTGSVPLPSSSPLRLRQHSHQLQQVHVQDQSSTSAFPCEQQRQLPVQQRLRTRLRTAQETKHEIIHIMLEPILETFGSISFRKALDRMPADCWWPLDQDVRMMVDHEARKSMVAIITAKKRQKREQQQDEHEKQQKQQENDERRPVSQEAKDIQVEEKDRKEKWHKVAGQRVRKWAKRTKKSKTEDSPSSSSARQGGSRSFFKRLISTSSDA